MFKMSITCQLIMEVYEKAHIQIICIMYNTAIRDGKYLAPPHANA